MASSDTTNVVKYFSTAAEGFTTTLASTIASGATSVPLNSTSGLTNGAVFVGIIEPGATAQQTFTGTVDVGGTQITNVVWVRGSNTGHAGGATIVDYVTGASHSIMTAGILKQHTQAGAHTGITTDTLATTGAATVGGTLAVTGATTLTGAVSGAGFSMLNMVNPYKFSVYRNAAQNTGNAADAVVNFDTKTFDTGSNVDIVTNKGRFTAPVAGFYQFNASIGASSGAYLLISLYKNGSLLKRGGEATGSAGTTDMGISSLEQLSAGDYIEIYCQSSSALAINNSSSGNYFQGYLVSAT